MAEAEQNQTARSAGWTFLTNHAHVLLSLAENGEMRIRDLALRVGITERAVQRIIADLAASGILLRERSGRRNRYTIRGECPLRHAVEAHCQVKDLLAMVSARRGADQASELAEAVSAG